MRKGAEIVCSAESITAGGKLRIHLLTRFILGHSKDEHPEEAMSTLEERNQAESDLPRCRHRRTQEEERRKV